MPRCRIDLLGGSVGVVYEYADLKALTDPSTDVISSLQDTDIEWAAADRPSTARFELRLGSDASARMQAFQDAFAKPFRLSCDDVELFVGVLYPKGGAAGLRTPVIHIEDDPSDGEGVVLWLGAWQGAWALTSGGGDATLRERIDRTELRAALCARGVLHELEAP
jgi:hypothetical protein